MRVCAHCGRENDEASRYCEDCGKPVDRPSVGTDPPARSPVSQQPAQQSSPCPHCKSHVIGGLPFCPNCGKRVTSSQYEGSACPKCGTPAAAEAQFCAACGKSFHPEAASGRTSAFDAKRVDVRAEVALLDEGASVIDRHPLVRVETTIGREGADIEFPEDAFMSPLHAQINIDDDGFVVRDLGSRNGTWIFIAEPYKLTDGDLILIGSQVLLFRRLGYPGPHPPERDATRRMGSLVPSADIAKVIQLRSDGSYRDTLHLSPGRNAGVGRERGDWIFPYDPSMSGLHAQIRSEDADFVVVDAGSRNGVAVSVRGEVPINHGSRFLVGDKMLRLETT